MMFARSAGQVASHAITDGHSEHDRIDRVFTFTGQSLQISDGYWPLLVFGEGAKLYSRLFEWTSPSEEGLDVSGQSQGAAGKIGKGRVVVFGESDLFQARVTPNGAAIGMSHPAAENRQLLLNVMHWLSGELSSQSRRR